LVKRESNEKQPTIKIKDKGEYPIEQARFFAKHLALFA
jgi:hypothetical protein